MKKYFIRVLGLKGSWKWAKKQMLRGKVVRSKGWRGTLKLKVDSPENGLVYNSYYAENVHPVEGKLWEKSNHFLSQELLTDYEIVETWAPTTNLHTLAVDVPGTTKRRFIIVLGQLGKQDLASIKLQISTLQNLFKQYPEIGNQGERYWDQINFLIDNISCRHDTGTYKLSKQVADILRYKINEWVEGGRVNIEPVNLA